MKEIWNDLIILGVAIFLLPTVFIKNFNRIKVLIGCSLILVRC
jgi:hypothetical protein